MGITTENGTIPECYDTKELDNRDPSETWLWLDGTDDYVSINPGEVMGNMVENCYNEDVLFLFVQFQAYLNTPELEEIKDDTDTDHIKGFRDFLNGLIESNGL